MTRRYRGRDCGVHSSQLPAMWADRQNKLRIAIDSANRQGKTSVASIDLARLLDIPNSAVQRMGRDMIDQCQVEGVVVRYMAGLFLWRRPDIQAVD